MNETSTSLFTEMSLISKPKTFGPQSDEFYGYALRYEYADDETHQQIFDVLQPLILDQFSEEEQEEVCWAR
jgi:hypothetical protein